MVCRKKKDNNLKCPVGHPLILHTHPLGATSKTLHLSAFVSLNFYFPAVWKLFFPHGWTHTQEQPKQGNIPSCTNESHRKSQLICFGIKAAPLNLPRVHIVLKSIFNCVCKTHHQHRGQHQKHSQISPWRGQKPIREPRTASNCSLAQQQQKCENCISQHEQAGSDVSYEDSQDLTATSVCLDIGLLHVAEGGEAQGGIDNA